MIAPLTPTETAALRIVREHDGLTANWIAKLLRRTTARTVTILDSLVARGDLDKTELPDPEGKHWRIEVRPSGQFVTVGQPRFYYQIAEGK